METEFLIDSNFLKPSNQKKMLNYQDTNHELSTSTASLGECSIAVTTGRGITPPRSFSLVRGDFLALGNFRRETKLVGAVTSPPPRNSVVVFGTSWESGVGMTGFHGWVSGIENASKVLIVK